MDAFLLEKCSECLVNGAVVAEKPVELLKSHAQPTPFRYIAATERLGHTGKNSWAGSPCEPTFRCGRIFLSPKPGYIVSGRLIQERPGFIDQAVVFSCRLPFALQQAGGMLIVMTSPSGAAILSG
jgi:hypothetical protein